MRTTDRLLYLNATRYATDGRDRAVRAQEVAASGMRVARSSDDPTAAARARTAASALRERDAHMGAADRGKAVLGEADSALGAMTTLLDDVLNAAMGATSTTFSDVDRATVADLVRLKREDALRLANAQVGGIYVFGGFKTGAPPFRADGTFQGDANDRTAEVAPGVTATVSASGARAFTAAGGVDLFAELTALETALRTGDLAGARARIDNVSTAQDQAVRVRSEVGTHLVALDIARAALDRRDTILQEQKAKAIEADPFTAYSELAAAQQGLEAALQVSAKVLGPSLLTFLR